MFTLPLPHHSARGPFKFHFSISKTCADEETVILNFISFKNGGYPQVLGHCIHALAMLT